MSKPLNLMTLPFLRGKAVVLPKDLVEYILPYAPPLPSNYYHPALTGALIYQNEKVPVVDLTALYDESLRQRNIDGKSRIVIISCIITHSEFSRYALIIDGAPRLLQVSQDDVKESYDEHLPPLFYSCVTFDYQSASQKLYVPDLKSIETQLFEYF